jgi:hypothetical protein
MLTRLAADEITRCHLLYESGDSLTWRLRRGDSLVPEGRSVATSLYNNNFADYYYGIFPNGPPCLVVWWDSGSRAHGLG